MLSSYPFIEKEFFMRKPIRVNIDRCRVVLFDLEFYVPETSRRSTGLCYNPWDKSCKLIGGSFISANPKTDFDLPEEKIIKKVSSLWLWDHKDEKELCVKIYELLKSTLDIVHKAHEGRVSPLLCGIGISSSDIPVLFELFKRYKILSNSEAFFFQSCFRIIDLSQMAIPCFNNTTNYLYPKVKNDLLQKYMTGKKFSSGKSVWELYEQKNHTLIEERVIDEVVSSHVIYKSIIADYRYFKKLEKDEKVRRKLELIN